VRARKAAGHANDDWALTADLIRAAGMAVSLDEVTAAFERLYQGDGRTPGLQEREVLTVSPASLAELAR